MATQKLWAPGQHFPLQMGNAIAEVTLALPVKQGALLGSRSLLPPHRSPTKHSLAFWSLRKLGWQSWAVWHSWCHQPGCGHKEKHRRRDLVQGKRQSVLHRVTLGWVPLPRAVEYGERGLVVAQESTLRHRGCTGAVVADKDPAAVPLPGRAEKQEKPALSDAWKQTQFQLPAPASFPWLCQLRRRPCRCWGLGGVAACPCKLQASRAPRQQRWLPVQDVPNMPFLPLCHLELPINPEQGTAWPRSRGSAEPDGASREEGFSPSSSIDGVPRAPGGMHCHTIDGNTALPAAGGPGMQEN